MDFAKIFNNPPDPPHSHEFRVIGKEVSCIFQALFEILKIGVAHFHSSPDGVVRVDLLTEDDMHHLNRYFMSFGIVMKWDSSVDVLKARKSCKDTIHLSDFASTIRMNTMSVTIRFDYLPMCSTVMRHSQL